MRTFLAPAHLALTAVILLWDIVLAGRIAQNRRSPRAFQAVSGLCALLVLPGLMLVLATSTVITGRAVATMDWIWPAVLVLFSVQAVYAVVRRLVNPAWGLPIMVYDILIAVIGIVRYMVAHGATPAGSLVTLLASQTIAMVIASGTTSTLAVPFYLNMPMVSPAFPAQARLGVSFRMFMSLIAVMWSLFILVLGTPRAIEQLRVYGSHSRDQLRERPAGDFAVGIKIFPDVSGPPPAPAIKSDSALVDSMDVDAVTIVVDPNATAKAIDSLAKTLDPARFDSTTLIVAIGYNARLLPELGKVSLDEAARLATMRRVIAQLHPDIILPANDPYGSGERAVGNLPPERWESFLTEASRVAKSVDPKIQVGVAASRYSANDSALYAWAASPGSPIDVVGFALFPTPYVNGGIETETRTADRWMRITPPRKDHWVFATGGYPLAYGERSQEEAVWEVLAWATDHPAIKGAIVYEAGDYGESRGLRAPNGRMRMVAGRVMRAIGQLRESAK